MCLHIVNRQAYTPAVWPQTGLAKLYPALIEGKTMAGESLIPATEKRDSKMSVLTSTLTLEQETNPWDGQAALFGFAAKKPNLDEGIWKVPRQPSREIIVHIP